MDQITSAPGQPAQTRRKSRRLKPAFATRPGGALMVIVASQLPLPEDTAPEIPAVPAPAFVAPADAPIAAPAVATPVYEPTPVYEQTVPAPAAHVVEAPRKMPAIVRSENPRVAPSAKSIARVAPAPIAPPAKVAPARHDDTLKTSVAAHKENAVVDRTGPPPVTI